MFPRRSRSNDDFRQEIEAHIELETERLIEEGMEPEAARHAARRAFGNVTGATERFHESRRFVRLEQLLQDLRYAARSMRKNPGFTAVVVLTLALGIGANTAIFSVIDAVLLKSLPVAAPEELFVVTENNVWGQFGGFQYDHFKSFQKSASEVAGLFGASKVMPWEIQFRGPDDSASLERVAGQMVTGNFFDELGVRPALGRMLSPDDDIEGGGRSVAVVSHRYWTRRFGNDRGVLGRTFVVHDTPFTIVGVAPPGFFGVTVGRTPDLWAPAAMRPRLLSGITSLAKYGRFWIEILGRPKDGVSRDRVLAAINVPHRQYIDAILSRIKDPRRRKPWEQKRLELLDGRGGIDALRSTYSLPLRLLMGVAGLVLLIACANVASLLLARATVRLREISVRLALGAGRGRLVRQWYTESLLLAGVACLLGVALAFAGARALVGLVSSGHESFSLDVSLDLRMLAFSVVIAFVSAILFGLAPALRGSRGDLRAVLSAAGTAAVSGRAGLNGRRVLAVLQVALSLVLTIGAGLFLRTIYNLQTHEDGLDRENVLVAVISPRDAGYSVPQRRNGPKEERDKAGKRLFALYTEILTRLEAIPGVRSATFSQCGLLDTMTYTVGPIEVQGHTPDQDEIRSVRADMVGPRFFETIGMRLLAGRDFEARDNAAAPLVVIVNETMARHYFPGGDAIGKRLHFGDPEGFEIVGVVRDASYDGPREEVPRLVYFPQLQRPSNIVRVAIRTRGRPDALRAAFVQAIRDADSRLKPMRVSTLDEQFAGEIRTERLMAQLATLFGLLALVVTCVGLYGLMAYSVARRTNEIGLRMALGAHRSRIVRGVLGEAFRTVVIGLVIGVGGALAAMRLTESLLFGLAPTDPLTIGAAAAVIIAVAIIAACFPAIRAARVDPMSALRYE